jgi:hypothetical protein
VNNALKLTVKNGSTFNLYDFNVGAGSTWKAWSNWRDAGDALRKKFIQWIGFAFQHDNLTYPTITLNIYGTNSAGSMDNTTPVKTVTHTIGSLSNVGFTQRPKRRWARVRQAYAVMMTGQSAGGDSRPIKVSLEGEINETV